MEHKKEIEVVTLMIQKYCRKKHKTKKGELCEECSKLLDYVKFRRSKCPFGDNKPFCQNCKIHCYNKENREKIREVMRFSGPRIIFSHPVVCFKHLKETISEKNKMKKETKQQVSKESSNV